VPWRHPLTGLWWFALPLLALGGVLFAPRERRNVTALIPALTAAVVSVPYLFMIDYAAPRFLLPSYALLALPVAECLWRLVTDAAGRVRAVGTFVVVLALAGHLAIQYAVVANEAADSRSSGKDFTKTAARLHSLGVRPPCVISGDHSVQLSFYTRCASRQTGGPDASITPSGVRAVSGHSAVAVIVPPKAKRPAFTRGWRASPLPAGTRFGGYHVYLPPDLRRSGRR
jgi:hypothetical protein